MTGGTWPGTRSSGKSPFASSASPDRTTPSGVTAATSSSPSCPAAIAHEGGDSRVTPAKGAVRIRRIHRIARAEDVVVQPLRNRLVVRPAALEERLPRVRRKRVGPQVAVVARLVAVGEDVVELRRAVPHDDLARHAQLRERVPLALARIARGLLR